MTGHSAASEAGRRLLAYISMPVLKEMMLNLSSAIQIIQNVPAGLLCLLEFLPIHAAGMVKHQNNILGDNLVDGIDPWGKQHHEETIRVGSYRMDRDRSAGGKLLFHPMSNTG